MFVPDWKISRSLSFSGNMNCHRVRVWGTPPFECPLCRCSSHRHKLIDDPRDPKAWFETKIEKCQANFAIALILLDESIKVIKFMTDWIRWTLSWTNARASKLSSIFARLFLWVRWIAAACLRILGASISELRRCRERSGRALGPHQAKFGRKNLRQNEKWARAEGKVECKWDHIPLFFLSLF